MRLKRLAMGLSLVATLAGVAGCGGGSDDKAQVRLLNASIGVSSLDLAVGEDETVVTSGVTYASVGDYEGVSADDSLLEVQNSTSGATLTSTTPTLSTSDKYTLIAYGVSGSVKNALITETEDTPRQRQDQAADPESGPGCRCAGHLRNRHDGYRPQRFRHPGQQRGQRLGLRLSVDQAGQLPTGDHRCR